MKSARGGRRIFARLKFLTLSGRYLSNPPFGLEKNDLLLTTGISVKIGR